MNTIDTMTEVRSDVWHSAPTPAGTTLIVERMTGRDEDSAYVVTEFSAARWGTGHYLICDGVTRDEAFAAVAKRTDA